MKTTDKPVVVEESFKESKENLWKAITELHQMKQWFFDNIESFRPEVGFETQFNVNTGERDFLHLWKITEVVPLKKITYNWKYSGYKGDSYVTFELNENGKVTSLILTCEIVEDFPDNIPEFTRESCVGGWNYFVKESLKQYIEMKIEA